MKRLICTEWERISRNALGHALCDQLQRFDEGQARKLGETVFDWSLRNEIRCRNWVGVICLPGLSIEIVPKIVNADTEDPKRETAQRNLLYMLAYADMVEVRERDFAQLSTERLPMLERIAWLFVSDLLGELRRGVDHAYVRIQENRDSIRGKLMLTEHLKQNAAKQHRVFVSYDEFQVDTWLNRCLRAVCRVLLAFTRRARTQIRLREALLHFDGVQDAVVRTHHLNFVELGRHNLRFHRVFELAKLILSRSTPGPVAGKTTSFSLLFPMESVFEEFIARFARRHATALGLNPSQVVAQSRGHQECLLLDERDRGQYQLRPDLLVLDDGGGASLVLDTKWKDLSSSSDKARQSDIYQMTAYAHRYRCAQNVLLYPRVDSSRRREFRFHGRPDRFLRIEFVDVARDFLRDRDGLIRDLRIAFGQAGNSLDARPVGAL